MDARKERWFFETWSPQDGIAFASKCDQTPSTEWKRSLTVSLSPPYWKARQVSAATARRAERQSFQVGFFDANGLPIGFDTLEDMIAVIRQAYLASGSGPAAEGPSRPPQQPPLPEEPDYGEGWEECLKLLLGGPGDVHASQDAARKIHTTIGFHLEVYFEHFAAVVLEIMSRDASGDTRHLLWCIQVLLRIGMSPSSNLIAREVLDRLAFPVWPIALVSDGTNVPPEHLFVLPNPLRPSPTSIGEYLGHVLASRARVERLSLAEFSLLAFAAAALVATTRLPAPTEAALGDWRRYFQLEGIAWLYRQLPAVKPTDPAGVALEGYQNP